MDVVIQALQRNIDALANAIIGPLGIGLVIIGLAVAAVGMLFRWWGLSAVVYACIGAIILLLAGSIANSLRAEEIPVIEAVHARP